MKYWALFSLSLISACSFSFERVLEESGKSATGRTVDESGTRVPFVGGNFAGRPRAFTSDANGRFAQGNLPNGPYTLQFSVDNDGNLWNDAHASRSFVIAPAIDDVALGDIVMLAARPVSGRVEYEDGTPAPGVRVSIFRQSRAANEGEAFDLPIDESVVSDDNGAFFIPNVPAEDTLIFASQEIAQPLLVSGAQVLSPALDTVVLTLVQSPPPPVVVEVLVFPAQDSPYQAVITSLIDGREITSDNAAGDRFNLALIPGRYTIRVCKRANCSAPDGDDGIIFNVPVPRTDALYRLGPVEFGSLAGCEDCDGDGAQSFGDNPPEDLVRTCHDFCQNAPRGSPCVVAGTSYDCDDEGDGQGDLTEGPDCRVVGVGGDRDGDGECNITDQYPDCVANDPSCTVPGDFVPGSIAPPGINETYLPRSDGGVVIVDAGVLPDALVGADVSIVDALPPTDVLVIDDPTPPASPLCDPGDLTPSDNLSLDADDRLGGVSFCATDELAFIVVYPENGDCVKVNIESPDNEITELTPTELCDTELVTLPTTIDGRYRVTLTPNTARAAFHFRGVEPSTAQPLPLVDLIQVGINVNDARQTSSREMLPGEPLAFRLDLRDDTRFYVVGVDGRVLTKALGSETFVGSIEATQPAYAIFVAPNQTRVAQFQERFATFRVPVNPAQEALVVGGDFIEGEPSSLGAFAYSMELTEDAFVTLEAQAPAANIECYIFDSENKLIFARDENPDRVCAPATGMPFLEAGRYDVYARRRSSSTPTAIRAHSYDIDPIVVDADMNEPDFVQLPRTAIGQRVDVRLSLDAGIGPFASVADFCEFSTEGIPQVELIKPDGSIEASLCAQLHFDFIDDLDLREGSVTLRYSLTSGEALIGSYRVGQYPLRETLENVDIRAPVTRLGAYERVQGEDRRINLSFDPALGSNFGVLIDCDISAGLVPSLRVSTPQGERVQNCATEQLFEPVAIGTPTSILIEHARSLPLTGAEVLIVQRDSFEVEARLPIVGLTEQRDLLPLQSALILVSPQVRESRVEISCPQCRVRATIDGVSGDNDFVLESTSIVVPANVDASFVVTPRFRGQSAQITASRLP